MPYVNGSVIDNLEPKHRQQVIDMLLAGESTRKVSSWIASQCDTKVSHSAVARYERNVLRPALANAAKLRALKNIPDDAESQIAATKELTKQALVANRLESRIADKYEQYARVKSLALDGEKPDIRGFAAVDQAETRTMQLDAELAGLANQQVTVNQTNNIVVMPSPNEQAQVATPPTPQLESPTIDAEFIDINSAT